MNCEKCQDVVARVLMDMEDPTKLLVVVRKTILKEDGNVDKKFGLTDRGDWVEVPEARVYPPECFLPIAFNRASSEVFDKLATLASRNRKE